MEQPVNYSLSVSRRAQGPIDEMLRCTKKDTLADLLMMGFPIMEHYLQAIQAGERLVLVQGDSMVEVELDFGSEPDTEPTSPGDIHTYNLQFSARAWERVDGLRQLAGNSKINFFIRNTLRLLRLVLEHLVQGGSIGKQKRGSYTSLNLNDLLPEHLRSL